MEASQSAPAQADAPAEAQQQDPGVITPAEPAQEQEQSVDLSQLGQQINTLQERFDAQYPQEQEGEQGSDASLADLFNAPEADPAEGEAQAPEQDWLSEDFGQPVPQFNSQQELDAYVQEKAAEVLQPYAFEQEMKARRESLGQLEEKYPDIHDYVDRIRPTLEARAQQYGIDPKFLATDPQLVEAVYKGLKADEVSAAEVPAEQSANAGATLETGTGPGSQGSEPDPGEAFANVFSEMARASTKDAFS